VEPARPGRASTSGRRHPNATQKDCFGHGARDLSRPAMQIARCSKNSSRDLGCQIQNKREVWWNSMGHGGWGVPRRARKEAKKSWLLMIGFSTQNLVYDIPQRKLHSHGSWPCGMAALCLGHVGPMHDPGRTRTCNLWFRRPTPYPLGHRASGYWAPREPIARIRASHDKPLGLQLQRDARSP